MILSQSDLLCEMANRNVYYVPLSFCRMKVKSAKLNTDQQEQG